LSYKALGKQNIPMEKSNTKQTLSWYCLPQKR